MSEDEKKAIEYWKRDIALYHWNTQLASEYYAQIILNLIEKQQKELEQEKEKNEKLVDKTIQYDKTLEKLQKDTIWKDKIKAKIKELEEEQKEYKGSQEWEIQDNIDAQINILKELLEEKENE